MSDIYKAPKSELEIDSSKKIKPNRTLVDLTFWIAHVGLILSVVLAPPAHSDDPVPSNSVYLMGLAMVSMFVYFFAIGVFAKRMGRSAVVWGLGSFLFSPLTVWITYIASFFIKQK